MNKNFVSVPTTSAVPVATFMGAYESKEFNRNSCVLVSVDTYLNNPTTTLENVVVDGYTLIDDKKCAVQTSTYLTLLKRSDQNLSGITRSNEQDNLSLEELRIDISAMKKDHKEEVDGLKQQIAGLKLHQTTMQKDHKEEFDGLKQQIAGLQKDHKEEVDGLKQQIDGLKAEMVDLGKNISRLVTEAIDQTRKESPNWDCRIP